MVLCIPYFHALQRSHTSALQDGGGSGAELTQLTVWATTTENYGAPCGNNNSKTGL